MVHVKYTSNGKNLYSAKFENYIRMLPGEKIVLSNSGMETVFVVESVHEVVNIGTAPVICEQILVVTLKEA